MQRHNKVNNVLGAIGKKNKGGLAPPVLKYEPVELSLANAPYGPAMTVKECV